ncbi:MAG: class I SAM-dependent methyltransferase [Dehalococcoidales bacterium]|nr:class I SAM-dependent methyltransferase [Dehalococcoidales bacterium]
MPEDSELTSYDSVDIEVYLKHVERPLSWNNLYERPAMLALLPSLKGKNVLDIGCASGFYTKYALGKGAYVTAVDISKTMVDRLAASIKSPNLKLLCADIAKPMPFLESDTYDCAICSLVLHYIKDWKTLLAELYRVLERKGRVIISTHHPFEMYQYLKLPSYFDFKLVEDTWGSSGPHPFNVRYYVRPLNEVLRPIIQSKFNIISIDEPLPDERCKELAPETYKRLMERPGFLFIILEK